MDSNFRCLVVSNQSTHRDFVSRIIVGSALAECDEATNFPEAMAKLRVLAKKKSSYKVIIIASNTDSMTVSEIMKAIKNEGGFDSVLILTPAGNSEMAQEAVREGANNYYALPLDERRLISKVRSLF